MATFRVSHPNFPEHVVRRAVSWITKRLGTSAVGLAITVGPKQRQHRGYNGWYRHRTKAVEAYVGEQITYPVAIGHNLREESWEASDPHELLVYLLAHELTHAAAYREAWPDAERLAFLNHEPRVRASGYRVMLEFRDDRERLLESWGVVVVAEEVAR